MINIFYSAIPRKKKTSSIRLIPNVQQMSKGVYRLTILLIVCFLLVFFTSPAITAFFQSVRSSGAGAGLDIETSRVRIPVRAATFSSLSFTLRVVSSVSSPSDEMTNWVHVC